MEELKKLLEDKAVTWQQIIDIIPISELEEFFRNSDHHELIDHWDE